MLTDLNWLNPGSKYPPPAEKERIDQYEQNEKLFLTKHPEVWKTDFDKIARRLRKKDHDVDTIFNYQQLLSKKTADFVCGEPPTFETKNDTDKLAQLLERQRFNVRLYEAIIDISRFGNAIVKFVGKNITAVSPRYWFPIVDRSDLKTIKQNVIAYPLSPGNDGKMTEIYVEIHNIGLIETRTYEFDAEKKEIGKLKAEPSVTKSNLDVSAIQILTNITHSGSIYGVDDYAVVNSIIEKIMWRLHCADTILDKHSEPSLSGPESALDFDEKTGMYYLNLGTYFKRRTQDDPDVQYITWDGNLESNFKEIDLLLKQLYTITEMGQAFMESGGGGNASSGTALKLRMVSPRIKAARLTGLNNATIKQIITLLAKVNGIALDYDSLTIHWNDGLPVDAVEQVNTLTTATGGKQIMSQYAAMKRMGLSDTEVEEELEQIAEEQAAAAPPVLSVVDQNDGGTGDE